MCHWWLPKYTLQFWTRTQKWTTGRGDILRKWSCSPSILNILNCVLGYPLGNSYTRLIWVDYNPINYQPSIYIYIYTNFQQNIRPNILVAVASIFGVPRISFTKKSYVFFKKNFRHHEVWLQAVVFFWATTCWIMIALWGWTASTTTSIAEQKCGVFSLVTMTLWLLIQRNPHFLRFFVHPSQVIMGFLHHQWFNPICSDSTLEIRSKKICRCLAIFRCDPAFNQQWVFFGVKPYSHFPTNYLFWYTAFPYVYHVYMGVSKNRGTPKWMIYNKTLSKWMIWGYHYFRKHPYIDIIMTQISRLPLYIPKLLTP